MEERFPLSDFVDIRTIDTVTCDLVNRFVERRKEMNMSRAALAKEANVSYASLRRFEEIGEISLASLMKLAKAMDMLDDFDKLFTRHKIKSLKDYLKKKYRSN